VGHDAIEWLTDLVLQAARRGGAVSPAALTLLLRRYAATGRDDVRDALGAALAAALDAQGHGGGEANRRAEWLALFAEAAPLTQDDRLPAAVAALAAALRAEWPSGGTVAAAMQSLDACLSAVRVVDRGGHDELAAAAVDELERVVGAAYRPGGGVAHTLRAPAGAGRALDDHVGAASALASAFFLTGRLPYSMLAEELMQFARRTWWDDRAGVWAADEGGPASEHFGTCCRAARVLCRLAALHGDDDYRRAAVIAGGSDYARDAERTLASLAPEYRAQGIAAAIYGVALGEWLALGPARDAS
jgi:hypothetical protein